MGDAELAKIGRHVHGIDASMKELVKVMAALNENFVVFVKKLSEWDVETKLEVDENQNTFSYETEFTKERVFDPQKERSFVSDQKSDADRMHELVADINEQQAASGQETTITQPQDTDG